MLLLSSALVVGSLACHVSAQSYWDPSSPISSANCIEDSFSSPRWGIYNPALVSVNGSSGGTLGDIRFLTVNSASGVVANCTANNIDLDPRPVGIWHNCSIPNLYFQFNLTTLDLKIKGSWTCDNSTDSSLVFAVQGTWETPLIQGCLDDWQAPRGQETLCIMGNSQVWGSLSTPINITPQLPVLPYTPAELPERCVDRSVDPEWLLEDLIYVHHHAQTGNKTRDSLSLNLTNISSRDKVACSVPADELKRVNRDGSSSPWVKCLANPNSPANHTSNITSTFISLDTKNGVIGVKQAWNCSDGIEGIEANDYTGTGFLTTGLKCAKPIKGSYNCTLASATFSGYSPDAPPMPHTAYNRSCTVSSIVNTTAFTLRKYQIDAAADGTKMGTFSLFNPGTADVYRLHRIPVKDDATWHDCLSDKSQTLPWQLVGCQYLLDRSKNHHISFQFQWYCDDRNPLSAILFNATASTQLPAEICGASLPSIENERWKGESCYLPASAGKPKMAVSSLTWTTTSGPMDRGPTLPWI
ncbi:hypothetical protein B0T22DRAFT_524142 [Podospora appendiculata]|uniref:AA1-like domain-containing protein n=1 Tax=Podospora appendiculata TaxID=314037 RepID=A0AAE1C706_9PEZI|nr:hypothetical protein B0T22DRAFT_524142 [Podospora appendiculata]